MPTTSARHLILFCISSIAVVFSFVFTTGSATAEETIKTGDQPTKETAVWNQVDNYLDQVTKNGAMRWTNKSMPLIVYIYPGNTIEGYRPEFTTLLEQAFSEWAAISQNHISFLLTKTPGKAQIICGWTSDKKEMTSSTEGGHALVVPDGHNIKQARITILTKSGTKDKFTDKYIKRVALHEVGHALGLANHSPNPDDIMYGTALPTDTLCTLTHRDKNTLIALYSIDQATIDKTTLNVEGMLPQKTNSSDLARIILLNAEAQQAMQTKNLAVAVAKLEEAHKIDPKNDLINGNLGATYGNCAMVASLLQNNALTQSYFDKALPLLSKSSNKENYISVLRFYENYLRKNRRDEEANKISEKIKMIAPR